MTPLNITHHWTWTGDHNLPNWLTHHHHWHHDRPVIHTADGPRTLYLGWIAALWTDNVITVGSATVAHRVYGPDGLHGRLTRTETAIDRIQDAAALHRQQLLTTTELHAVIEAALNEPALATPTATGATGQPPE